MPDSENGPAHELLATVERGGVRETVVGWCRLFDMGTHVDSEVHLWVLRRQISLVTAGLSYLDDALTIASRVSYRGRTARLTYSAAVGAAGPVRGEQPVRVQGKAAACDPIAAFIDQVREGS